MATGRGQQLPGWLQDFLTSTTRGMEAAQRNAEVAREQAAKEAEKHAQLLAEQDKRHKEQMQAILDRLQPAVPPTPVATPPGQAPGLSSQSAAGPSARSAAQPPAKLEPGISLREFRVWRASWEDFFELADGSRLTQERQKALLRTCLTTEMRATLAHAISVADTATVYELLNAIGAHFRRQRNIALSCVQFEERKQQLPPSGRGVNRHIAFGVPHVRQRVNRPAFPRPAGVNRHIPNRCSPVRQGGKPPLISVTRSVTFSNSNSGAVQPPCHHPRNTRQTLSLSLC